ncbi:MAG: HEPN domain-containing protein [Thermoflexales bacterium]|nr:HEPN domain-containing protein [Thermoflexales bacterium]
MKEYDSSFEALRGICRRLDQDYIPPRYPNGLPDGIPQEVYTADQAQDALAGARKILEYGRQHLPLEAGE